MKAPKIVPVSTSNTRTDLVYYRGDHVPLRFVPTAPLPGTAVVFTVAARPDSRTKIVPTRACTLVDGAYETAITSAELDVTPGRYFWDARLTDAGSETLLGSGVFEILACAQLPR